MLPLTGCLERHQEHPYSGTSESLVNFCGLLSSLCGLQTRAGRRGLRVARLLCGAVCALHIDFSGFSPLCGKQVVSDTTPEAPCHPRA